jgi:hypothetical protein
MLTSAPLLAPLHLPVSRTEALTLLGEFGVEAPVTAEVDDLHAIVHQRYEQIHGYRPTVTDRLRRLIGIRKRWPMQGVVITTPVVRASRDLTITIMHARVAQMKLVFIATDLDPTIAAQLFTLKRLAR